MAKKYFNDGQELVFEDFNKISTALERTFYDRAIYEIVQRTNDSFFGDSFKAAYLSGTSVQVGMGLGFQDDPTAVSPNPTKKPLYLASPQTVNIPSPDASLDRIDIVVVKNGSYDELTETRKYKSPTTSSISTQSFVVQKDDLAEILVVTGTPAISPVAPSVPSGFIKIAELYMTAAIGMVGSSAVTDSRNLMPLGGNVLIDTLAFERLTQSASTPISTLFQDVDALLKNGYFEYTDFDELVADPSTPSASKVRVYYKDGVFYYKDSSSLVTPIGSGGGGGSGAAWYEPEGSAPLSDEEFGQKVYLFEQGQANYLSLWIRVPSSYISGRPIKMKIAAYSPSTSNDFLLKSTTTLVRVNNDSVNSTANQRVSTNTALVNTVSNRYREIELDLTAANGTINSVAVSGGDMIKIDLVRGTDTDTSEVRFIKDVGEITFQ